MNLDSATQESYQINVRYLPPGPNRTRGWKWYQHKAEREKQAKFVFSAWREAGRPQSNGRPAILNVVVHAGGLEDDQDNRVARLKSIIDCLVSLRVLEDDHPDYLELSIPQRQKATGKGWLEINVQYK